MAAHAVATASALFTEIARATRPLANQGRPSHKHEKGARKVESLVKDDGQVTLTPKRKADEEAKNIDSIDSNNIFEHRLFNDVFIL